MTRLDNNVALVVGGTTGIGLSTAEAFIHAGATVVVAGRNAEAGRAAVEHLRSSCLRC